MPTAVKKKPKKRVIIKGVEHGLSGYTNYGCRCDVCTDANAEHSRQYRERRFAGSPLCSWPTNPACDNKQSRGYGNGLCDRHAKLLQQLRQERPRLARKVEKALGVEPQRRKAA